MRSGPDGAARPKLRACTVFCLLLGLPAVLMVGAAQAGSSFAPGRQAWKLQRARVPARAEISGLSAVACSSRRACTAVGSSAKTLSTPTLTLAERWNGTRWRIQSTPTPKRTSPVLYGVSCPSARSCVAVGNAFHEGSRRTTPLIEAWNGRRWRVQVAPAIKGFSSLYAVSCTSRRACTAVGFYDGSGGRSHALVERWNGNAWRLQALPRTARGSQLLGVSCSKADACTAVGDASGSSGNARPLAESWNGERWHAQVVASPSEAVFSAVSCTSASACTATGNDFGTGGTLAERWNGKTWHRQWTPNPPNYIESWGEVALDGVSCTSKHACAASGEYSPGGGAAYFIESWNGKRWRLKTAPHPSGFQRGALLGMSCAPRRCTAVGAYTGRTRLQVTLAMAN